MPLPHQPPTATTAMLMPRARYKRARATRTTWTRRVSRSGAPEAGPPAAARRRDFPRSRRPFRARSGGRRPRARARGLCARRRSPFRSIPIRRAARRAPPAPATSPRCSRAAISRCCSRPPTRRSAASSTPALARYPRRASCRLRGRRRRRRASPARRRKAFACGRWSRCSGRSIPAARPAPPRFTLARVEPGEMPEGRIQILTHRTEHMVWQPRWLSHPNGALGLRGVMIAVADVEEAAQRFARFTGRAARCFAGWGSTIELDRGRVDLVTRRRFRANAAGIPIPSLPFVGACGIRVISLPALDDILQQRGAADAAAAQRPGRAVPGGARARAPGCSRNEHLRQSTDMCRAHAADILRIRCRSFTTHPLTSACGPSPQLDGAACSKTCCSAGPTTPPADFVDANVARGLGEQDRVHRLRRAR